MSRRAVVHDTELTLGPPVDLGVTSGPNAPAHCADCLWPPCHDQINRVLAPKGATAVNPGLPSAEGDPSDRAGHELLLYISCLSAHSFSSAGSGLNHKTCHVLGGRPDLPHAPRLLAETPRTDTVIVGLTAPRRRGDAPRAAWPTWAWLAWRYRPATMTTENLTRLLTPAWQGDEIP
ncbi:iron-containing alcohol dehydrogenase [Streptomyces sp. NPDC047043]|uniref:iron-containing alcohol dehydrogenase n=1 Tax=Streptomyces sp. NPDC047043 TaxID=3154497 RepID=UPI0033F80E19